MRPARRRARHNGRKRDMSADPKYRRRNYNKPARANRVTVFSFCKRCNLANRVDRSKWARLEVGDRGVVTI